MRKQGIIMKRISMTVLAGLLLNVFAAAQMLDFNQFGRATQESVALGFFIAHPTLPLNSRIMVANTLTGEEVEAIVASRIPASATRIADISIDAWLALNLSPYTEIRLFSPPVPVAAPVVEEPPPPEPVAAPVIEEPPPPVALPPEETLVITVPAEEASQQPIVIHLNLHLAHNPVETTTLPTPPPPPVAPPVNAELIARLEALEAAAQPAPPSVVVTVNPTISQAITVDGNFAPAPPAPIESEIAAGHAVPEADTRPRDVQPTAPLSQPRGIPAPPEPVNGKTYRLQVGVFSSFYDAADLSRYLSATGFVAIHERFNSLYHVIIADVPAAMLYPAARRLGVLGISHIVVKE